MDFDRLEDRLVDVEVEARREDDRAHHPDRILEEAHAGIADRPDQPVLEIAQPADVVDDRVRGDVVEERVDREVAAEGVLFGRAEDVVAVDQPLVRAHLRQVRAFGLHLVLDRRVGIDRRVGRGVQRLVDLGLVRRQLSRIDLAAERRDLDRLGPELDVREAEAAADDPAVAEELLDLVGMRRGADVEVLRAAAEQQVADAAADEVRGVAVFVQPVQDLESVGIDVATRNRVL